MSGLDGGSRRRVLDALNHRVPDRVPFDLGSSIETGITVQAYEGFLELLGVSEEPDGSLYNLFVEAGGFKQIPENVLRHLGVDTRGMLIQLPSVPADISMDGDGVSVVDEWGIRWVRPASGLYLDPVDSPLRGELTREGLDGFVWPDPVEAGRFVGVGEEARRLRESGCAVVGSLYGLGIFDMAHMLCGMEGALVNMMAEPVLMEELLDRLLEFQMRQWEAMLQAMGENVDVCLHSDDFGTQEGPLISPEMYRTFFGSRHRRLFEHIKRSAVGEVKVLFHSCGSVRALIPDFIETGIDALNPVQVGAAGMDTRELKREFGKDLCFWGGGVDTQRVLPYGSPGEVREEVRRRVDDLAGDGGFVFAAVHNVQPDVPPENLVAMWEALREFGG